MEEVRDIRPRAQENGAFADEADIAIAPAEVTEQAETPPSAVLQGSTFAGSVDLLEQSTRQAVAADVLADR